MIWRWVVPILWGCGLLLLGWVLDTFVPPQYINLFRLTNGFLLVAMMAWIIQRDNARSLRYERDLKEHRAEILALMERHEEARNQSVAALVQQTERIATEMAATTGARADALEQKLDVAIEGKKLDVVVEKRLDVALQATLARADSIETKLDVVIDATKQNGPSHE